jgi:hypothetical protein
LSTYTGKTVTLNNALESLTLGSTDSINKITFNENVHDADFFAKFGQSFVFRTVVAELCYCTLGSSVSFFEMADSRLRSVFLLFLAESELNSRIAVLLFILYLRYYARTSFDYGTGDAYALCSVNAGHSYFLSYNSRHVYDRFMLFFRTS